MQTSRALSCIKILYSHNLYPKQCTNNLPDYLGIWIYKFYLQFENLDQIKFYWLHIFVHETLAHIFGPPHTKWKSIKCQYHIYSIKFWWLVNLANHSSCQLFTNNKQIGTWDNFFAKCNFQTILQFFSLSKLYAIRYCHSAKLIRTLPTIFLHDYVITITSYCVVYWSCDNDTATVGVISNNLCNGRGSYWKLGGPLKWFSIAKTEFLWRALNLRGAMAPPISATYDFVIMEEGKLVYFNY